MFQKIIPFIQSKIGALEKSNVSAFQWLAFFSAVVFLRNIAEGISSRLPSYFTPDNFFFFLHAYGFYLISFVGLIFIIRLVTREDFGKIGKFVFYLIPLILIPPIADIIASGGHGAIMTYRQPLEASSWQEVLVSFWDFVTKGPFGILFSGKDNVLTQLHMNYGIRIEISIFMLLTAAYVFSKTLNAWRVVLGSLFQYAGLFMIGHFPFLVAFISGQSLKIYSDSLHRQSFFNPEISTDALMFGLYLLIASCIGAAIAYLNNPKKYIALVKNLRFWRVFHNFFVLGSGVLVGIIVSRRQIIFSAEDVVILLSAFASILFYWASAVFYNDSTDIEEDSISSRERPIPSGLITKNQSQALAIVLLLVSVAFASIVGYMFLLMILARSLVGYLYSSPSVRLKKIPLISQITLSLAYLFTMLAGFFVINSNLVFKFPSYIAWIVILGFTLGSGFKDIKDFEGDKNQGVMTIPVIFGLARGKFIIGIMGFLAFMSVFVFFPGHSIILFILSFTAGVAHFWAVTEKKYKEWIVFAIYLIFFAFLGVLYFMGELFI